MKFKELCNRTDREINFIIDAVNLNSISHYVHIPARPETLTPIDLHNYITSVLSCDVWNHLISCYTYDSNKTSHTWNTESSKKELRDILNELGIVFETVVELNYGSTFKTNTLHPVKILFGDASKADGFTNPSHKYQIFRVFENTVHCIIVGHSFDPYYIMDKNFVESCMK